jgi:DNA-binding CsgD family transcriptional regulator
VRRGFELADLTRAHVAELVLVLALAGAAFNRGELDVAVALDAVLRPEWVTLSTVIPYAGLRHYEQIVERRRAEDPDRVDRLRNAATASRWRDGLALAVAYAARGPDAGADASADGSTLTPRELEVLAEIAQGRTNKEIAQVLGMRPKTVMHHCAAIYRKLGVRTRAEAAATALRTGLLDRDH